jgi:hypothetical protein
MHAAAERMGERTEKGAGTSESPGGSLGTEASREALLRIDSARGAILEALASIPRAEDYAPFARQLREIASVSPSLLTWLSEVPTLSAPLASSMRSLLDAASSLQEALEILESGG